MGLRAFEALSGWSERTSRAYTRVALLSPRVDLYECPCTFSAITEFPRFFRIFLPSHNPDLFLNLESDKTCFVETWNGGRSGF